MLIICEFVDTNLDLVLIYSTIILGVETSPLYKSEIKMPKMFYEYLLVLCKTSDSTISDNFVISDTISKTFKRITWLAIILALWIRGINIHLN